MRDIFEKRRTGSRVLDREAALDGALVKGVVSNARGEDVLGSEAAAEVVDALVQQIASDEMAAYSGHNIEARDFVIAIEKAATRREALISVAARLGIQSSVEAALFAPVAPESGRMIQWPESDPFGTNIEAAAVQAAILGSYDQRPVTVTIPTGGQHRGTLVASDSRSIAGAVEGFYR